jgi:hypothetical protein
MRKTHIGMLGHLMAVVIQGRVGRRTEIELKTVQIGRLGQSPFYFTLHTAMIEVVVESDGRIADHDNEVGSDLSSTSGKARGSSRLPLGVRTTLDLST